MALPIDTQKVNCLKTSRIVQYTQNIPQDRHSCTKAQRNAATCILWLFTTRFKELGTSIATVFISLKHCKTAKGKVKSELADLREKQLVVSHWENTFTSRPEQNSENNTTKLCDKNVTINQILRQLHSSQLFVQHLIIIILSSLEIQNLPIKSPQWPPLTSLLGQ